MHATGGRAVALGLAILASTCTSSPGDVGPQRPSEDAASAGMPGVTVDGIRTHLEALQRIADENGGTRAVGTPGYEASVDYVMGVLDDAGYEVELRSVAVPVFEQDAPTILELVGSTSQDWVDGTDLRAMLFSAGGEVRARVTAGQGGCEPADLAGFPAGDVALLEPGPCLRRQQVVNAQEAGASAVVVVYPGTEAGRPLRPTLLYPDGIVVPVLAVTPEVGDVLSPRGEERPSVHIRVDASSTWDEAASVLAQTPTGDPGRVLMLGAHLDSVMDGPGINDNGSGVAMLLELARWLAAHRATATVRFAFWAGEEEGLYGSRDYVQDLADDEREAMLAYLNADMVGSPNFMRYVLADTPTEPSAAEGTGAIRELFTSYFEDRGLEVEQLDTHGGADHGPFAEAGIPVGGLSAGAAELKSSAQAQVTGGQAGLPLDPCYHQACDTSGNVSDVALEEFSAAFAHVLARLASVDGAS